jgi:hypothetical protein
LTRLFLLGDGKEMRNNRSFQREGQHKGGAIAYEKIITIIN